MADAAILNFCDK